MSEKKLLTEEEKEALKLMVERVYKDREFAIETLCRITNKSGKKVPFKLWNHQKKLLRHLMDAINLKERSIVCIPKQRQNGTSKMTCANNVVEARLFNNRNSLYLIKSDEDTQPFFDDKVKEIDEGLPEEFTGTKVRDQSTSLKYKDTNSAIRINTAGASEVVTNKKGRSGRENYIHVTEAAFIEHLESLYRAARGSMPPDGTMVFESSMDGPKNYFYQLCMGIKNDEEVKEIEKNVWRAGNRWLIFLAFWEFTDCRRRIPENFMLRDDFEKDAWESIMDECGIEEAACWYIYEYRESQTKPDCDDAKKYMRREHPVTLMDGFMDSAADYFDAPVMKTMRKYIEIMDRKCYQFGLMRQPGAEGKEKIIFVEPDRKNCLHVWALPEKGWRNRYCMFLDPAQGGNNSDFDSFHVFDRVTRETVAMAHARLGGEALATLAMNTGAWYENAWMSLDTTGGYGDECKGFLLRAYYPSLFSFRPVENIFLDPAWLGLKWNESIKYSALAWLKHNWQEGYWRILDLGAYDEAEVFGYPDNGRSPCAAEGFHDDKIMDLAGMAYMEPNLPAPVKTDEVKPFVAVNEIQRMKKKMLELDRNAPKELTGMGNYD